MGLEPLPTPENQEQETTFSEKAGIWLDKRKRFKICDSNKAGKGLAAYLKFKIQKNTITSLLDGNGTPNSDPTKIVNIFKDFYEKLYARNVHVDSEKMKKYLSNCTLPTPTTAERESLNEPISESEVVSAIKSLKKGKAPGPDGYTAPFYKTFAHILATPLLEVFHEISTTGEVKGTMAEAVIAVIPKEGSPNASGTVVKKQKDIGTFMGKRKNARLAQRHRSSEAFIPTAAGTGQKLVQPEIPKLCQQGPEYWCQSDETASLCMKEDFCVELWQNAPAEASCWRVCWKSKGTLRENKEWRSKDGTNQLRRGLGLKCRACKYVFNYLKKKVSDDHSEEEISSALDKVCKSVLFLLRIPCKMVVRKYRDAITQAFEDEEDSATFCAKVKLCRNAEETDVELSYQEDPKLCLQSSEYWCQSEETASLCKKEDYCMELWQNVPAELEASSDGAPEDATEEEEEKRKKKKKKNKKRKKDKKNKKDKKGKKGKKNKKRKDKTDVKCSGCTQIVTNLQKTVGENLDDDTVNGAVDSMCDEVDESISEICTTMKENNKDDLVEAVKNGDSPKDICTQIQMCKGQELDYSEVTPQQCNNFLSTYGPMVKHVLLKPWDEVTTCQEVGACEAGIPMPQFDVKRAASRRKDLEDTRSTQLVMVNA
ncbi:uncharacterized protein LOC144790897 [Lissotriton helveticus]